MFKMIYLLLSRSIAWPVNLFGWNTNKQTNSILDVPIQDKEHVDQSSPLISNKDLAQRVDQSTNMDDKRSLIDLQKSPQLPSTAALSALGKHYLTREDLEKMIQARFEQETPRDRITRLLWKDELGKYPVFAKVKDFQCTAIAMGLGCAFGLVRKEEMKPVYIRQTSMSKFQDRLTAERAFRQFNVVMFMKEAYKIAILVLFITETITTTQYTLEAYRNKSTIYDAIPGGALVGFMLKMLHSPLGAAIATVQGAAMGFIYGFVHNVGYRLIDRTYENVHYEQTMQWILYRENAELWSASLDELPSTYQPVEQQKSWGLGWFKS